MSDAVAADVIESRDNITSEAGGAEYAGDHAKICLESLCSSLTPLGPLLVGGLVGRLAGSIGHGAPFS